VGTLHYSYIAAKKEKFALIDYKDWLMHLIVVVIVAVAVVAVVVMTLIIIN